MSRNSQKRRAEKKEQKAEKEKTRLDRRMKAPVPSIATVPDHELLELVPRETVEAVLGESVRWEVLRTRDAIRDFNLSGYNTSIFLDLSLRTSSLPKDFHHPLRRLFPAFQAKAPDFAELAGAPHNQAVILGRLGDETCVDLHLAGIYPESILIEDIELANLKAPRVRLMPSQKAPGLGHGIFNEVLTRLRTFAMRHGFKAIRAHAVDQQLANIFQRRGFQPDRLDRELFERSRDTGIQIPLVLPLEMAANANE